MQVLRLRLLLSLLSAILLPATVGLAASGHAGPAAPRSELLLEDPLTSANLPLGATLKSSRHGEFTDQGWRSVHREGQLVIELADNVALEGALEVDLSGLDWPRVNAASGADTKLHFLNMASNPTGDHHAEGGGTEDDALWTLRAGAAKDGQPRYGRMFKVLWASRGAKRTPGSDYHEQTIRAPEGWDWDKASRYTFRVTWSRARVTWDVAINGRVVSVQPWKSQVRPLRYIFLGKGGDFESLQGVIFSNLRIYRSP